MKKVICVAGPTASGKTAFAVSLAEALGGEVVSCDSMQIYRGMEVGTAAPSQKEMCGVRHYMVGTVSPDEPYSVSRYVEEADKCVQNILNSGKIPIIAGGTGLYMDSLIKGLYFSTGPGDGIIRKRLDKMYTRFGGLRMHRLLQYIDKPVAERLHPNDKKRVCRALEIYFSGGGRISEHDSETKERLPRYNALYFALSYRDRALLYRRIDKRVDMMLANGLLDEVRRLLDMGLGSATAMQAIGYKELSEAVEGRIPLETAVDDLKRASRRYAKRQLTWLRKNEGIVWFYRDEQSDSEILRISTDIAKRFLYNGKAE